MAGQPKRGLDCSYWDNHMFDVDERIDEIIDAQDWAGVGIYMYLSFKIFGTNGYYYQWTDRSATSIARHMSGSIKSETVKQVVQLCLRVGLFDKGLFDRESVLSSKDIQTKYMSAVEKRSERGRTVEKKYWLLNSNETRAYINISENDNSLPENDNSLPENTIKESKVKKRKEKQSKDFVSSAALQTLDTSEYFIALILNTGDFYLVRHNEVDEYRSLYPAVDVEQELRSMCGWLKANPKNRKTKNGIERFINSWLKKTQDRGGVGYGKRQSVSANNRPTSEPGTTTGYQTKNVY